MIRTKANEDWVVVEMWSAATVASVTTNLNVRIVYRGTGGRIGVVEYPLESNILFQRRAIRRRFAAPTGELLSVAAYTQKPGIQVAELYCQISLTRDLVSLHKPSMILCRGYVYEGHALTDGVIEGMLDGPGKIRELSVANPAAGANLEVQIPEGTRWRLRYLRFNFTTSATVADRVVSVKIVDGAVGPSSLMGWICGITQTASLGYLYSFSELGVPALLLRSQVHASLPPIVLSGTRGFGTDIIDLQVGDQVSAVLFGVEEWMDYQIAL